MKRRLILLQLVFFSAFLVTFWLAMRQWLGIASQFDKLGYVEPTFKHNEEFDPSLYRLNTMSSIIDYCDSICEKKGSTVDTTYQKKSCTEIVSSVIRRRFYHGYSLYNLSNNFVGTLMAEVNMKGLRAIVIPDDILKYPYAACSQQSIIMMEILRKKGIATRKVTLKGREYGHFTIEAFYNGGWHFLDTNMEPDMAVLNAYGRPAVEFLVSNKDVLLKAYHQYPPEMILDIFSSHSYGQPKTFPAPKAYVFQIVTKFLSNTVWAIFLLLFVMVRRKYLRLSLNKYVWNRRISVSRVR